MKTKFIISIQLSALLVSSIALASPFDRLVPPMKGSTIIAKEPTAVAQNDKKGCLGQDSSELLIPSTTNRSEQLISKIDIRSFDGKPLKEIDDICTKINNISNRFNGKVANIERVSAIRDAITLLYIEKGFITSRAELPKEPWLDAKGTITFPIIEGKIGTVAILDQNGQSIESNDRVNRGYNLKYVKDRIQLGLHNPLNIKDLGEQVRLLELDPLFNEDIYASNCQRNDINEPKLQNQLVCRKFDATLRPSQDIQNSSNLIVKIPPTRFFRANINFDNSTPPSIGAERLNTNFGFANLAGIGDNLITSFQIDPLPKSESRFLRFAALSYQIPLNPMNGTVQVRAERRREKIIQQPLDQFDLKANAELYELAYRQPLVRGYTNEFALSLGLTVQNGQTFVFNNTPVPFGIGPNEEGISRTSVIKFGQDYTHRGVTGTWILKSQFSLGTGLFGSTRNSGSIPDGQFIAWLGQIQRLQQLNDNNLLIMQADLQLSSDPLLPSQQFVLGGSQSLRGYRQNIRFGDNGVRFSIEDRITLSQDRNKKPVFQIAPFLDVGKVWNQSDNPNSLSAQKFLAAAGLGLIWQPFPKFNLRLDYAPPLINLRDKGKNLQDNGIYFTINYQL
jgi:hemolysin activation/secretion protein